MICLHLTWSKTSFKWLIKTTQPRCENKISSAVSHVRRAANSLGSQTWTRPKAVKPVRGAASASRAFCPSGRQSPEEGPGTQKVFFVVSKESTHHLLTTARSNGHSCSGLSSLARQFSSPPAQIPPQSPADKIWVGTILSKHNTWAARRHETSYIFWTLLQSTLMVTPQRCASKTCFVFLELIPWA